MRSKSRGGSALKQRGSSSLELEKPTRNKFAPLPPASHTKLKNHWRETAVMSAASVPILQAPRSMAHDDSETIGLGQYPALVLNADYTPLSYLPLSLWSWQDTLKAVLRDAVVEISHYDRVVRSPSSVMRLPSVIVLKHYVNQERKMRQPPSFTRRNLYLRDQFCCQYCKVRFGMGSLTYDHVVPRARNGRTGWENVVTACTKCNLRKGHRMLEQISDMKLSEAPRQPTWGELQRNARNFPPKGKLHPDWEDFVVAGSAGGGARGGYGI